MKSFSFTVFAVLAAAFASVANAQDTKTIRIATEGAFPPWNMIDASGKPEGFDVEVGNALCERAKLKCEFVAQAWDGIIPGLNVGKYDAIMAGMSITEKRKQVITFSEPYAATSNYFVMAKALRLQALEGTLKVDLTGETKEAVDTLNVLKENLKGKTIGVQGATNAESFVRQYFGDAVEIRTYDKQDNLNMDLVAGRIDGGLADFSVWKGFLESADGAVASLYGPRISGGLFGPGVGIGIRKVDTQLVEKFNDAIRATSADGTLKAISIKWFGEDLVTR